jgi:NADPH:quinone reductase
MPPPNSSGGRVPGFEGAGVVSGAGARIAPGLGLKPGLRMAFFPAPDSLRDEVVVQAGSVVRLLDSIPDEIGTQMLINTGAALTRMTPLPRSRTGVIVLVTGARSAVGRLVGKLLTDWGVKAGSVRSETGAEKLAEILPGSPIPATEVAGWKRRPLRGRRVTPRSTASAPARRHRELLAEGTGTVINFGSLHGETSDVRVFSPRPLTLKGRALRPSDAAATGATPSRDRRSGFDLFIPVKELTVCPETSF